MEEASENFEYHQSKIRRLEVRVAELELIISEIDAKLKLVGKQIIAEDEETVLKLNSNYEIEIDD